MDNSFKKFLDQRISNHDEATFKDMFNDLFFIVIHWINRRNELVIVNEKKIFQKNFYGFLCNQNEINNYDEYFDMKYSDEIIDLFLDMKEITKSYGSLLALPIKFPPFSIKGLAKIPIASKKLSGYPT